MSSEKERRVSSGWGFLFLNITMFLGVVALIIMIIVATEHNKGLGVTLPLVFSAVCLFITAMIGAQGFFVLPPHMSAVLLLFGKYVGTVKDEGFHWANPFYSVKKLSLRLRNLNGERLKVNDNAGNPIEIAAVVVWQIEDTYEASFEVDNYEDYVMTQSESAIRHLASAYPYDTWEDEGGVSLRGDIDTVSEALEHELQERLGKAGVRVNEARLSHLAYAPEIAEAMLRRQQASAVIAARTKIVEGAVSMVRMALDRLKTEGVIEMDDERKASMVSNLLVVLCSESHAQPVVNTGTLYN